MYYRLVYRAHYADSTQYTFGNMIKLTPLCEGRRDAISRNQCASLTDLFGVEFVAILCRGERSRYARAARIAREIVSIPPLSSHQYVLYAILQNKNIFFSLSSRTINLDMAIFFPRRFLLFFLSFFINNIPLSPSVYFRSNPRARPNKGRRLNMNSELAEIVKQNYIADVFFQWQGGRIIGRILNPFTGEISRLYIFTHHRREVFQFDNSRQIIFHLGET